MHCPVPTILELIRLGKELFGGVRKRPPCCFAGSRPFSNVRTWLSGSLRLGASYLLLGMAPRATAEKSLQSGDWNDPSAAHLPAREFTAQYECCNGAGRQP